MTELCTQTFVVLLCKQCMLLDLRSLRFFHATYVGKSSSSEQRL